MRNGMTCRLSFAFPVALAILFKDCFIGVIRACAGSTRHNKQLRVAWLRGMSPQLSGAHGPRASKRREPAARVHPGRIRGMVSASRGIVAA